MRHDTNRPADSSQDPFVTNPPTMIPVEAESDGVPQTLHWRRFRVGWGASGIRAYRPHPLLCGGKLGVIDVLPDHPHEGYVVREEDIDLAARCWHDPEKDEYPTVSGLQARPRVIAWVNTLADPPHVHEKGEQPDRRFPAISVYDGDSVRRGRVVVDSTWHHWFNMNILGLEKANPNAYAKITQYFLNAAIWLARRRQRRSMAGGAACCLLNSHLSIEEVHAGMSRFEVGVWAYDVLQRRTSDRLVEEWIRSYNPGFFESIDRFRMPKPPIPCWSCPPDEIFHKTVLGGVVLAALPLRDKLWNAGLKAVPGKEDAAFTPKEWEEAILRGAREGLAEALTMVEECKKRLNDFVRAMGLELRVAEKLEDIER